MYLVSLQKIAGKHIFYKKILKFYDFFCHISVYKQLNFIDYASKIFKMSLSIFFIYNPYLQSFMPMMMTILLSMTLFIVFR